MISVYAEQNSAKLIDFNPMKSTTVKLPSNCSLIISNSLT